MLNTEYIDTPKLKVLADAGAITYVSARGVPGGFVLVVKIGQSERMVRAQNRTNARVFATMDGIVSYCSAARIRRIEVDLAGHEKASH